MKNNSIKNVILITIDSLRYDRLGYVTGNMHTSPTIDYLAKHGISCDNAFTHASPTQMAMPSLFTSSLPLDHGGYDTIRHRPCTMAEALKAQGFRTIGLNSGTAMSSFYGYDRGFDEYYDFFSLDCFFFAYRKLYCEYYYELFVKEVISKHEFVTIMSKRIAKIFDYIEKYCRQMLEYIKDDFIVLDNVLTVFPYEKILKNIQLSREAIKISPDAYIFSKVDFFKVSPRTYSKDKHQTDFYEFLLMNIPMFAFKQAMSQNVVMRKVLNRIPLRYKKNNRKYYGRLNDDSMVQNAVKIMSKLERENFFLWMHLSDVHFSLNNYRLLQLPRWMMRRKRETYEKSDPYYDLSLHSTDNRIRYLVNECKKTGLIDSTLFVITSDHGNEAGYPQRNVGLGSASFYDEFLHIPLIFFNPSFDAQRITDLVSTLDVGPTILDMIGERKQPSFQGQSIIGSNYSAQSEIIGEHLHRGPCDIARKPIYLCVRTKKYKLIWREYVYEKDIQNVQYELYDLVDDPNERNNRYQDKELISVRDELLKIALRRYGIVKLQRGEVDEAVCKDVC